MTEEEKVAALEWIGTVQKTVSRLAELVTEHETRIALLEERLGKKN